MLTCIPLPQLMHPPQKFIDRARTLTQELVDGTCKDQPINVGLFNKGYNERTYLRHGVELPTRLGRMYSLGDDFIEWVKDYIHPHPQETGMNALVPFNAPIMGPHIDTKRKFVLFYMIELGGDNVQTVWYKEHGHTLDRTHCLGPSGVGYYVRDYKDLEVIDMVNMQRGIWYLISPKIIHSVENVMGPRTAITVSVPDMDQFPWKNRAPVQD